MKLVETSEKNNRLQQPTLFEFPCDSVGMDKVCQTMGVEYNTPGWPDKLGKRLATYIVATRQPKIRTLSLFSGAGGLDIGFHDLGFDIVASVEIEDKFCETLRSNSGKDRFFENSTVNCVDIRQFTGDGLGQIDWIIGGPPCQTFSAAGRRASGVLGTTDARGVLFREYVRLLKRLHPKGFLFENVYGIVGAQGGEPWHEIVRAFRGAGYTLYYRILDAADYGVPQHRERLIIIGLRDGECAFMFPRPLCGPDSANNTPFYNAKTAIEGLKLSPEEAKSGIRGRYGKLLYEIPPGLNYSFYTKEMGNPHPIFAWRSKFSDLLYKADPDMPVKTIKASGGQYTGPLHWNNRYFALSEYKRLQTFPDDYFISGTKAVAVKQIGNSVPPQLARMLAVAIRSEVFGTPFPFHFQLLQPNAKLSFRKRKRDLTEYYRAKAKAAIDKGLTKIETGSSSKEETFKLTLTKRFDYVRSDDNGRFDIAVDWTSNVLNIQVKDSQSEAVWTRVVVTPTRSWTLPVKEIELNVQGRDWLALTAAWKTLDRELIDHRLKADLTQLNGYYQYPSQLNCKLESEIEDNQIILRTVIEGECVQRNIKTEELAHMWNVEREDVRGKAIMLKQLGYEVRNTNTNPQIANGEWLIPYKFPTLVPQSVQLYKEL